MAIYITGDCHGDFNRLFDPRFSESDKKSIDYKRIVLVCTVGVVILMGIGSIIAGIIRKRKRRKRRKRLRKRA